MSIFNSGGKKLELDAQVLEKNVLEKKIWR